MVLLGIFANMFSIFSSILNFDLTIVLVTISLYVFYWYWSRPKNLPPGPLGLPIVGYLPFLSIIKTHEQFNNMAKKYGPIFSLYLGNRLVIVLNNYETIKEAFVRQGKTFAGRPLMNITIAEPDYHAVPFADGEVWKTQRRFALNLLRDLGVGKLSIEPLITDEIAHFLIELQKSNGEPTNFSQLLTSSVSNNICILIYGKRFEYDDPWFIQSKLLINEQITKSSTVSLFTFFPWLSKLPGLAKLWKQDILLRLLKEFKTSMFDSIRKARSSYKDDERDNYMNAFIGEQKTRQSKDKNDDSFSDIALEQNVRSLMVAGTETTANTLMWAVLCMIRNPEIQSKIQKEIDEVVGTDRTPCWNDRLLTPYTEAALLEIQRFTTLLPLNVPHKNIEECELFGYTIPKNTMIMSNLWAVHNDANLWEDPEVFRPERFLTPNGEVDKKEYLIPFSLGKRECLGISLAKMELYLYFATMLQKFTFKNSDGSPPSMEVRIGVTAAPKYFNIRSLLRNQK